MNIYIYNVQDTKPNECVGILDTYTSVNFTKSFQDCGKFTIKGNFTPEARTLLQVGNLVYINPRVSGIIETVDFSTDDKGITTYTVGGKELKGILDYRIVWNTYNQNVDCGSWIVNLVGENTKGNRKLFTTVEPSSFSAPKLDKQVSYCSLLKAVSDASKAKQSDKKMNIGFDVICDIDKGFTFKVIEGTDRTFESEHPYVVSRDMDNVSSLGYAESSKSQANIVKVGGEGEGSERKFATAGDDSISGLNRREIFKDSRNTQSSYTDSAGKQQTLTPEQYQALLQDEANSLIQGREISVDAESIVTSSEALDLLGSKVSLIDRAFGVRTDDYISEVNIIDEADGTLTTITVGKGLAAQKLTLPMEV